MEEIRCYNCRFFIKHYIRVWHGGFQQTHSGHCAQPTLKDIYVHRYSYGLACEFWEEREERVKK